MSSGMDEEEAMMSMQQRHLYLILDDWKHGYSYRKIDLSSHASGLIPDEGIARGAATCLPAPFFRLKAKHGQPFYFTASGSKIWGMHPKEEGSSYDNGAACFDVHAETFAFVPRYTDQMRPIYFHIGDKLFALGCLSLQSLDIDEKKHPTGVASSWSNPLDVPVDSIHAISHVVFPDGRTIFVSVGFVPGEWVLPFHGRGYFDGKLNTWIGLSLYREKPGHICSCDLASSSPASQHSPDVKYTKDSLFTMDPDDKHLGATLVYLGRQGSKFCLVECITTNDGYERRCNFGEANTDDYKLRLTTFYLEYNSNGDRMIGHRWVRYYKMPKHVSRLACHYPAAFWM
ncbi:unnamed protein product [Urochloa decumbens]|uniref:F-box protein n=1 Tax=Urochloa decumbens TaxID=240449 RepID=A0ABC8XI60_9POAL